MNELERKEKKRLAHQRWVDANRDLVRARAREWYQKNRERRLFAQKERAKKRTQQKKEYDRERRLLKGDELKEYDRIRYVKRRQDIVVNLLRRAKTRAKKKGVPFSLTKSDIFIPEVCPALGMTLMVGDGSGGKPNSPSLDRIIPELGYVPGNIAVISLLANSIKSVASSSQVMMVAEWMKKMEIDRVNRSIKGA